MLTGYFILVLVLFLQGSICLANPTHATKRFFLICSFLDIFLLAVLRSSTFVTDDKNYLPIFWGYAPCYFEWGLCQLNKVIILLGKETYVYFGALALLVFSSIWSFICKYSCNVFLSVLSFVCLMYAFNSVNVVRQFIALSIVLYSFPFIIQRRFALFSLFLIIACFFHTSAIVCISFYWLYTTKVSARNICLLIMCSILIFLLFNYLSDVYTVLGGKYAKYVEVGAEQTRLSGVIRFVLNFIITSSALLVFKLVPFEHLQSSKLSMNFLVLSSCVATSAAFISLNAYWTERIAYYFYLFNILTLPQTLYFVPNKHLKVVVYLIATICLVSYGAVVLWSWEQRGMVYSFFWQY